MNKALLFDFTVDKDARVIRVDRSFDAPLDLVWSAWTEADILDQWWAPKPFQNVTLSMQFAVGGKWHYYMESPQGERHYCFFEYSNIEPMRMYAGKDGFCDEQGNLNTAMPGMQWQNSFEQSGDQSIVHVLIRFEKVEDLEAIIAMGFKEGFTMGLQNLDQYIAAQFYLRKQKKGNTGVRVSTYVNFPGNADEAMHFYRDIFKTEFIQGIQRFADLPADPAQPPMAEGVKNMVLHCELPLIGGHVLMATDAPAEMGFTVTSGNNMHINLDTGSRAEAERIFNALSAGGKITMPLQEMFWGAYFGSLTDKYGINWMVNAQQ